MGSGKHTSRRVGSLILGSLLVIGLFVGGTSVYLSADSPRLYEAPLTGVLSAGSATRVASPNPQSDAEAVCDDGGFVQFTPDGTRPFSDTTECLDYAAQHGGTKGLIRRVRVLLSDYGSGASVSTGFTVTGLVPQRQYVAILRIQNNPGDPASLSFLSDEQGNFAGKISSPATRDCIGGTKMFVDVRTMEGYLLGTNGTFLPC